MGREEIKRRRYVTAERDTMAGSGQDGYAYEDISGCLMDEQEARHSPNMDIKIVTREILGLVE
jgi:hypothetical protein